MRPVIVLLLGLGLAACSRGGAPEVNRELPDTISVTSSAFTDGAKIPTRFTCAGANLAPPLAWSGAPKDAVELALVVDDPDAPGGTYTHWVLFHLDPGVTGLQEGQVPPGARQAHNSGGEVGYTGPCPPGGPAHHYRFTVYALSDRLDLPDRAKLDETLQGITKAATARGRLTGTFAS